jgi:uncharacterized membrane protein YbjE (DUF340 family)
MKGSIITLAFFSTGVILAYLQLLPSFLIETDWSELVLMMLMLLVGVSLGANREVQQIFRQINLKIVLVPISCIVGTFIGVTVVSLFINDISVPDALAVGSGFGYYSLSSILITQVKGEALGVVALLSNIIRELITLLLAPLMVTYFGKLAPITAGGATTIDTTLPIITRYSGQEFIIVALFNGIFLEVSVPVFVYFFIEFF